MKNTDKMKPAYSFDEWKEFESPRPRWPGPPERACALAPSASFSIGQAFFTEDPRISVANPSATGPAAAGFSLRALPLRAIGAGKGILRNGCARDVGPDNDHRDSGQDRSRQWLSRRPGTRHAQVSHRQCAPPLQLRHTAGGFLQGRRAPGNASTEFLARLRPKRRAPSSMLLQRWTSCLWACTAAANTSMWATSFWTWATRSTQSNYEAIPVGETRMAVVRPFLNGRLELGVNGMVARGYTGQTTETFAPGLAWAQRPIAHRDPARQARSNDFDCGTKELSVGIRMVSWVGGSISWRFRSEK